MVERFFPFTVHLSDIGEELLHLGRSFCTWGGASMLGEELRYSPIVEECYIYILVYISNCLISQVDNICLSVCLSVRTRLSRDVILLINYYAFSE